MQGCKISVEQALMGCSESITLDLRANVLEGFNWKTAGQVHSQKLGYSKKELVMKLFLS